MPSPLPIDSALPGVLATLAAGRDAIVVAPPGTGKTTRVPPAVLRALELAERGHPDVILLQPRRIAVRAAARRMAEENGWRLGGRVGYQVRFDRVGSAETRLWVLTEGLLTRRLLDDPFLETTGVLILDEFHERSLHSDLVLAMAREVQRTVRPDLRIVVMSATMDPGPVAEYLGAVDLHRLEVPTYPVGITYLARHDPAPVAEKATRAAQQALGDPDSGHILVFLPGMGEIRRTHERLLGSVQAAGATLHILHSSVSAEEQDRTLTPTSQRKVILSTNIAETSLTIDGVRTVVDSGQVRRVFHDARLGLDRLELGRVSLASADQRAGRAGRTAPGICHRLWTAPEHAVLEPAEVPELQREDLAPTVLALKAFGIADPLNFPWFQAPPAERVERAHQLLVLLGACDAKTGRLTPLGSRMAALGTHPRLARLLLQGAAHGHTKEAATLAALLEEDLPGIATGDSRAPARHHGDCDIADLVSAIDHGHALDAGTLARVRRLRDEFLRRVPAESARHRWPHAEALRRLLLEAYPDRVTVRRAADPDRGLMVGGRGVVLEPVSSVRKAPIFLSLDPREVSRDGRLECRVSMASSVEAEWLEEAFPTALETGFFHDYDPAREKVISVERRTFLGIVLWEKTVGPQRDPSGASEALYRALLPRLPSLLEKDEAASGWLARARFLARCSPESGIPLSVEDMAEGLREACEGCTSLAEVTRGGLLRLANGHLSFKQRALIDAEAPESLSLPSGHRKRLEYPADGAPILAVRLQEMFGSRETPRVARGRVPVVLHLLGPNFRPVQITTDLAGFWQRTYTEVRKDLRARYPRHHWPDDPANAPPVVHKKRVKSGE